MAMASNMCWAAFALALAMAPQRWANAQTAAPAFDWASNGGIIKNADVIEHPSEQVQEFIDDASSSDVLRKVFKTASCQTPLDVLFVGDVSATVTKGALLDEVLDTMRSVVEYLKVDADAFRVGSIVYSSKVETILKFDSEYDSAKIQGQLAARPLECDCQEMKIANQVVMTEAKCWSQTKEANRCLFFKDQVNTSAHVTGSRATAWNPLWTVDRYANFGFGCTPPEAGSDKTCGVPKECMSRSSKETGFTEPCIRTQCQVAGENCLSSTQTNNIGALEEAFKAMGSPTEAGARQGIPKLAYYITDGLPAEASGGKFTEGSGVGVNDLGGFNLLETCKASKNKRNKKYDKDFDMKLWMKKTPLNGETVNMKQMTNKLNGERLGGTISENDACYIMYTRKKREQLQASAWGAGSLCADGACAVVALLVSEAPSLTQVIMSEELGDVDFVFKSLAELATSGVPTLVNLLRFADLDPKGPCYTTITTTTTTTTTATTTTTTITATTTTTITTTRDPNACRVCTAPSKCNPTCGDNCGKAEPQLAKGCKGAGFPQGWCSCHESCNQNKRPGFERCCPDYLNGGCDANPLPCCTTTTTTTTPGLTVGRLNVDGVAKTLTDTAQTYTAAVVEATATDHAFSWTANPPSSAQFTPSPNVQNPAITFTAPGKHTLKCVATSSSAGDSATATHIVQAFAAGKLALKGAARTLTEYQEQYNSDVVGTTLTDYRAFKWSVDTTGVAIFDPSDAAQNPKIRFSAPGSYTLTCTAKSASMGSIVTATHSVDVGTLGSLELAGATQTLTQVRKPYQSTVQQSTLADFAFAWTADPASSAQFAPSANVQNPQITFVEPGDCTLACVATSQSLGAKMRLTETHSVKSFDLGKLAIAGAATTLTQAAQPFTSSITGASLSDHTFAWTASPSGAVTFLPSPNVQNPKITFAKSGPYALSCAATSATFVDANLEATHKIEAFDQGGLKLAGAAQTPTREAQPYTSDVLGATATDHTFKWTASPNTAVFFPSPDMQNPKITFPAAGNYTLTCVASSQSAKSTTQATHDVQAFDIGTLQVAGQTETLTSVVQPYTSSIEDATATDHTFAWTVNPPDTAMFSPSANVQNPTILFTAAGAYTLTCVATSATFADAWLEATHEVVASNLGTLKVAGATKTLTGVEQPYTSDVAGATATDHAFRWTASPPGTAVFAPSANVQNPNVTFSAPGQYKLTCVASSSSDASSLETSHDVEAFNLGELEIGGANLTQTGTKQSYTSSVMDATAADHTYAWAANPPGTAEFAPSANVQNPTITFAEPGVFTLTCNATSPAVSGAVLKATHVVEAFHLGNLKVAGVARTPTAASQSYTSDVFSATATDHTFAWSANPPGTAVFEPSAKVQNPNVIFTAAGTYTLTCVATSTCCTSAVATHSMQATHEVQAFDLGNLAIAGAAKTPVAVEQPYLSDVLNATAAGHSFKWTADPPGTASFQPSPSVQNPNVTFTAAGAYTLTCVATSPSDGTTLEAMHDVEAYDLGTLELKGAVRTPTEVSQPYSSAVLNSTTVDQTFAWTASPSTAVFEPSADVQNPTIRFTAAGRYTLTCAAKSASSGTTMEATHQVEAFVTPEVEAFVECPVCTTTAAPVRECPMEHPWYVHVLYPTIIMLTFLMFSWQNDCGPCFFAASGAMKAAQPLDDVEEDFDAAINAVSNPMFDLNKQNNRDSLADFGGFGEVDEANA